MNNPVFLESDKSMAYSHGKILKPEKDLSNGSSDLHLLQQMAAECNPGHGIEESLNKVCLCFTQMFFQSAGTVNESLTKHNLAVYSLFR